MSLTYGELFAGYDGLGMGVRSVLGGESLWMAEFDKAPSKILAHHYPNVPNLGDVTKVDWAQVPRVDVITGGSPCQDVSSAGKRAGMKAGTRSGLWSAMCDAVDIIRPRLVVWENVRGALSAEADSSMEQCPGCVGDGDDGPVLRALGRVLGDLADVGYDARWYGLRAADVGAAHGRFRIFVFATPADAISSGWHGWSSQPERGTLGRTAAAGGGEDAVVHVPGQLTLPTPRTSDTNGAGAHGECGLDLRTTVTLLPTPAVNDMGAGKTVEAWDDWTAKMQAAHGNGNGHGKSLSIEAARLPTQDWGIYAAAIARAEHATGRPAPSPTEPGAKGQPRLSPRFVEWMMMLPDGWVTDVPDLTRNDQLKALGNGVVPAQVAAATRAFLTDTASERAA